MDFKPNPKRPMGINESIEAMRSKAHKPRAKKSLPPRKGSQRKRNTQDTVDYFNQRRGLKEQIEALFPAFVKAPRIPKAPYKPKTLLSPAPDPEATKRDSLAEQLSKIELPMDARKLLVAYSFDEKPQQGVYTLEDIVFGDQSDVELEAANLRHFQVRMLQGILKDFAPTGNIVLSCDALSLVEHFNQPRWQYYRANDWKEPNGDKLQLRCLYAEIDDLMKGRIVAVTFPEPNLRQVEKLTERVKALMKGNGKITTSTPE